MKLRFYSPDKCSTTVDKFRWEYCFFSFSFLFLLNFIITIRLSFDNYNIIMNLLLFCKLVDIFKSSLTEV